MFQQIEQWLVSLADKIPLEIFAPLASFVEEVVAPIPSPVVMVVTGSLAEVQGRSLLGLGSLVLLATVGKLLGAVVVYFIADKTEDLLAGPVGRFFRVTHQEIESLGAHLKGGFKDYLVLTFLRALPVVPSVLVSVGSGVLKIPLRLFIVTTILGTIIRDSIYIYIGFVGAEAFNSFLQQSASIESLIEIITVVGLIGFLSWLYWRRRVRP